MLEDAITLDLARYEVGNSVLKDVINTSAWTCRKPNM